MYTILRNSLNKMKYKITKKKYYSILLNCVLTFYLIYLKEFRRFNKNISFSSNIIDS